MDRMLQFFEMNAGEDVDVSVSYKVLAEDIVRGIPSSPERTIALRKLLEARDATMRAIIFEER